MAKTINQLQGKIMRSVYYAFLLRMMTHPITVHTMVFMVAAYALTSLVYVERVLDMIATTQVADLGTRIVQILLNADTASVVVLGVMIFAALSLPLRLPKRRMRVESFEQAAF